MKGKRWAAAVLSAVIAMTAAVFAFLPGKAGAETTDGWILCQPDSFVNVREWPRKTSRKTGFLELGEQIRTDGETKNGFLHIVRCTTESGDGWVSCGYVVSDQPQVETCRAWIDSAGRVACRRATNGERRKWLHGGDELTLYACSAEWSVTSEGFVRTEYLIAER